MVKLYFLTRRHHFSAFERRTELAASVLRKISGSKLSRSEPAGLSRQGHYAEKVP